MGLHDLQQQFVDSGAPVGLLMHDCPEFNNVAVDSNWRIRGFGHEAKKLVTENADQRCFAFTGIHIIHPLVLKDLPAGQPGEILTPYRAMIGAGKPPGVLRLPKLFWREIGSIASYRSLHDELGGLEEDLVPPLRTGKAVWLDPDAEVSLEVRLRGYVSVGRGTRIADGVELEDSILWDNIEVRRGSSLRNCVVTDRAIVAGNHENEIIVGSIGR